MYWVYFFSMIGMATAIIPYALRLGQGFANTYYWYNQWTVSRYAYINFPSFDSYTLPSGELTWSFIIYAFQRYASPTYLSLIADVFLTFCFTLLADIPVVAFFIVSLIPAFTLDVVVYNIWPYLNIPYLDFLKYFGFNTMIPISSTFEIVKEHTPNPTDAIANQIQK